MNLRKIGWLGTRTDEPELMADFFGRVADALIAIARLASHRSGGPHPLRHRGRIRGPLVGSGLDLAGTRPVAGDQRLHVRGEPVEGVQRARNRLEAGGAAAWDAEVQGMVDRRQAMLFLVIGTAALVAIMLLMVFKPG